MSEGEIVNCPYCALKFADRIKWNKFNVNKHIETCQKRPCANTQSLFKYCVTMSCSPTSSANRSLNKYFINE